MTVLQWLGLFGPRVPLEGSRIVVLSPHLDDAAFSLGAGLHRAARHGADITVLTVFAGDPASNEPAGSWDTGAGFSTQGESASARRREDARSCALLGVTPRWLPFADDQYAPTPVDVLEAALHRELEDADLVLVPGFPLEHQDHALLNRVALGVLDDDERALLYAEQPYSLWHAAEPPAAWRPAAASLVDRLVKVRACRAYPSQLRLMGARLSLSITRFDAAHGGELVGAR